MKNSLMLLAALGASTGFARVAEAADQVVQIPIDALLNARSVTTLTNGALVTWTKGIDGGGSGNGYETDAASAFHKDPKVNALPDDGTFAADARHPAVVLHFSNAAPATGQQTHAVNGAGTFTFDVPSATYSKLFLFVTSAEGSSALTVTLNYGATSEVKNITVPDYYNDVAPTDPVVFYLASNMAKWSNQNTIAEMNHHNLDGIELTPMAGQMLTSVKVDKTAPGYLVFWGATGIATSAVVNGGGGAGGASGAGGAGGASGGATGAGVAGSAGSSFGGSSAAAGSSGSTAGASAGGGGASGANSAGASASAGANPVAGSPGAGGSAGNETALESPNNSSGCSFDGSGPRSAALPLSGLLLVLGALSRRKNKRRQH